MAALCMALHLHPAHSPGRWTLNAHLLLPAPPLLAQLVFVENTADDPSRRKPDITKAKTLLGWQPKVGPRGMAVWLLRGSRSSDALWGRRVL
jgi:nucleoside-diphosphate-sugar epimerase